MIPAFQTLDPAYAGDTWKGISALTITITGAAPTTPVSSARMQWRTSRESTAAAHEITSSGGGIIITDSGQWSFVIPEQSLPLNSGIYVYDFETTNATGAVKTYLHGTHLISGDVTK